jgi:hypothetical protein
VFFVPCFFVVFFGGLSGKGRPVGCGLWAVGCPHRWRGLWAVGNGCDGQAAAGGPRQQQHQPVWQARASAAAPSAERDYPLAKGSNN